MNGGGAPTHLLTSPGLRHLPRTGRGRHDFTVVAGHDADVPSTWAARATASAVHGGTTRAMRRRAARSRNYASTAKIARDGSPSGRSHAQARDAAGVDREPAREPRGGRTRPPHVAVSAESAGPDLRRAAGRQIERRNRRPRRHGGRRHCCLRPFRHWSLRRLRLASPARRLRRARAGHRRAARAQRSSSWFPWRRAFSTDHPACRAGSGPSRAPSRPR